MAAKKEHVKEIEDSEFNRSRAETETLRSNCKRGYIFTNSRSGTYKKGKSKGKKYSYTSASGQMQFHHILCISSISDGEIQPNDTDSLEFFHNCMAATKWDINESHNLIGLPTKAPYLAADKKLADKKAPATMTALRKLNPKKAEFGALKDLPCHLNDHPSYTTKVTMYVNKNVWKQLAVPEPPCTNKGENIYDELKGTSDYWYQFLKDRGEGADSNGKGAVTCWVNRQEYKDFWYIPFSMDPGKPKKILPPPNIYASSNTMKEWLSNVFSTLS